MRTRVLHRISTYMDYQTEVDRGQKSAIFFLPTDAASGRTGTYRIALYFILFFTSGVSLRFPTDECLFGHLRTYCLRRLSQYGDPHKFQLLIHYEKRVSSRQCQEESPIASISRGDEWKNERYDFSFWLCDVFSLFFPSLSSFSRKRSRQ